MTTPPPSLLGIAGSMKIYPFIFLGLYLLNRRFRPILLAAVIGIVSTLLGLRFLTPSILFSWHGVGDGLANYNAEFATNIGIVFGYDHSVFTLVKALVFFVHFLHHRLPTLLKIYYLVAAVTRHHALLQQDPQIALRQPGIRPGAC